MLRESHSLSASLATQTNRSVANTHLDVQPKCKSTEKYQQCTWHDSMLLFRTCNEPETLWWYFYS